MFLLGRVSVYVQVPFAFITLLIRCNLFCGQFSERPKATFGSGRICRLKEAISIADAVNKLKRHLGVPFVQLALARNMTERNRHVLE